MYLGGGCSINIENTNSLLNNLEYNKSAYMLDKYACDIFTSNDMIKIDICWGLPNIKTRELGCCFSIPDFNDDPIKYFIKKILYRSFFDKN